MAQCYQGSMTIPAIEVYKSSNCPYKKSTNNMCPKLKIVNNETCSHIDFK